MIDYDAYLRSQYGDDLDDEDDDDDDGFGDEPFNHPRWD